MKNVCSILLLSACLLSISTVTKAQQPAGENEANLSELLYRPIKPTAKVMEGNEPSQQKLPSGRTSAPMNITRLVAAPKWNRAVTGNAQLISIDNGLLMRDKVTVMKGNMTAFCTTPTVTIGCCGYSIKDEVANKNLFYASPASIFNNEADARTYAESLSPKLPFYLPYTNSKVFPSGGWIYSGGSGHGSIDFLKTADAYGAGIDPTFGVYASAPGKVVTAMWDQFFGNVVIIEHTAADGTQYRTGYFHLRGGFDHDLQNAKNITVADPNNKDARDTKYKKFANLPNPSKLLWGTNDQQLKVKAGDQVYAGQQIAWSGNTGFGGAGWGLNQDGTPIDPNTGNNHLHFMLWITSPNPATGVNWMEVDAYGVYATADNSSCYEVGAVSPFNRFFAPFYPSFHNVPVEYITRYWGYYTGMGMALQTLSVHKSGNQYLASGSFQYGLSSQWYCRINMSSAQYQQYFDEYYAKGYIPRQIAVTNDNSGNPLFTVIWKQRGNENFTAIHNATDDVWNAKWKTCVDQQKMRVTEHVVYYAGGKRYHAGVFGSNNPGGFYMYYGMNTNDFTKKFDELNKAGLMTVNVNIEENGSQNNVGGLWWPRNKAYYSYMNMTPADYQTKFQDLNAQGYQLYRIQGYDNSSRFAAIWMK
ncbi:peptidase M23-like protein [Chitinophaga niastensis]|uniref:Peptidase M23-like protein n=1 Tax=Chitinophaga niastensis TaxID=536980 RepID=A0A2P8HRH7_CHINA|nr:M23 family metallopeptidase [Chitinophaga niastensis]PSL48826.1 peptidase M23-like protein [Chitinophaga niastensis]